MRDLITLLLGFLLLSAAPASAAAPGGHAFMLSAIEGGPMPLEQWQGRPIFVVNTASFCGFTGQYADLQAVWERYRDRGLVVIGVPSNDFNQETGSSDEIRTFCEVNFAIDFPLADKTAVRGREAHPLFVWFREQLGEAAGPRWNFFKFLIGPDGRALAFWPSQVRPDSPAVSQAIESVLPPAT